ncbi:hypothetical protein LH19_14565 [Sphingopyxis macrogoltabida]|nr:hypothetical protein LH19_14565 [Sphingopyxis macrogoltabida]
MAPCRMSAPRNPSGRLWEAAILFTAMALAALGLAIADLAAQVLK